jgi:uncharacterized membrane protein
MINPHHPSKKEFQLERLILFSDAVFAIAITLLIIEIKVPELEPEHFSEHGFINSLLSLTPKFFGFVFSFFVIGLYWYIHHRMFGFVIDYTGRLIWLNMVFLFSIVLMPFSTAVYSEYSTTAGIKLIAPYSVYVFNICLTGVLNYFMWRYIGNPKNSVTEDFPAGDFLQKAKIRSLLLPATFLFSLMVAYFVNPYLGRYTLFLIPVVMSLVKNKRRKNRKVE